MNQEIRKAVRQRMKERSVSQTQLAEQLGINRVNLTRMLAGRSGKVPDRWQKVLDALELELTVKERS